MAELHRPKIAILASGDRESGGGGGTVEHFIRGTQVPGLVGVDVGLVICNNPRNKVGVYGKVEACNREFGLEIPVIKINGTTNPRVGKEKWENGEQTLAEAEAIYDAIVEGSFALSVMMGYMKKLKGSLLDLPILNNHPGPLPQTKGKHGLGVQEEVFRQGLSYSGHTLHVATEEYDEGEIVSWTPVLRAVDDTPEDLFDKVQIVEKAVLLTAVPKYIREKGLAE